MKPIDTRPEILRARPGGRRRGEEWREVMPTDTVIADAPPSDGREWDSHCARCGSSVTFEDCGHCGGEGVTSHDCGEDTCCCLHPEDNVRCDVCNGRGGWYACISPPEWCEANPAPLSR